MWVHISAKNTPDGFEFHTCLGLTVFVFDYIRFQLDNVHDILHCILVACCLTEMFC